MYWEDIGTIILLIILIGIVFLCSVCLNNEEKECNQNGGVWVEHYLGGQCFTKEDIERLNNNE